MNRVLIFWTTIYRGLTEKEKCAKIGTVTICNY